jgi:RNA polymerase sigma factor (sigma-70 family)
MVAIRNQTPKGWKEYSGAIQDYVPLTRDQEYEFVDERERLKDEIEDLKYQRSGSNGQASSINLQIGMRQGELSELENRFVEQNMNLLYKFAFRHYHKNPGVDKDELISKLQQSLLNSVRKFGNEARNKFSTFAVGGFEWAVKSLHRRRSIEDRTIHHYMGNGMTSDNGDDFYASIEDTGASQPAQEIAETERRELVRQKVEEAIGDMGNEVYQYVIRQRFGFNDEGTPLTLKHLGNLLGVTKENIRQIQNRSLGELAENPRLKGLDRYLTSFD